MSLAARALEQVFRAESGPVLATLIRILGDFQLAEDALQDAYLEAYRHLDAFRGDAELSTWLTRIVVTQSLMRLRKQKRSRVVVAIADPGGDPQGTRDIADTRAEAPRDAAFRAEVRRIIERRIDALPLNFRTVFVMRELEDLSVQETAACLGIPEATVRTFKRLLG